MINKVFIWIPRILAIIMGIFISLFAFDVFQENSVSFKQVLGFIIHLAPSFFIFISLLIAWKYYLLGGIIFILVGVFFTVFFHTYKSISSFLLLSLSLFIIGTLFIICRYRRRNIPL